MATRKVKNAKDLSTGELIYFKGHAQATYMSDGTTVEDAIKRGITPGGGASAEEIYIGSEEPTDDKYKVWINPNEKGGESEGGGSGVAQLMTEVTYNELVTLRDNGNLIPGMKYRITDYETKTSQAGTTSAGHPFDIIVTALDNRNLDEKASTIHSARDINGYFAKSNLHAWNILYCLDNDTSRFGWALIPGSYINVDFSEIDAGTASGKLNGTYELEGITYAKWDAKFMGIDVYILTTSANPTIGETPIIYVLDQQEAVPMGKIISVESSTESGKGVIYRMVDENNNDIPYDFKNILFTRKLTNGEYDADNGVDTFVYTFNVVQEDGTMGDYSVESSYCFNNRMELSSNLADNVFLNVFGGDYDTTDIYELGCHSNHFGQGCSLNTFGTASFSNVFGRSCFLIVAGEKFRDNQIGTFCDNNVFGDSCENNIIGFGSHDNVFGDNCSNNYIGSSSFYNTFGEGCSFNDCGEFFENNNLGDSCSYNTFGDFCQNNVWGGECFLIVVGNSCKYIQIGEQGVPFYAAHIVLKAGVSYIKLISLEEASNASRVEYYTISNIKGTSSEVKEIECFRDRDYETFIAVNSNGEIKSWNPADLL